MSNKGFVYLDFRNKVVYFANEKRDLMDSVPATIAEREAFITHFYSKGIKECTFKQLKQYVNFHGTRKQGRVYATIQITDEHLYLKLMRKNEKNLQSAIDDFVRESFGRKQDNIIKNKAKFVAKHALKLFLKSVENEMEKIFDE